VEGLDFFLDGLRKGGRLGFQIEQARIAVQVYWIHFKVEGKQGDGEKADGVVKREAPRIEPPQRDASGISGDGGWRSPEWIRRCGSGIILPRL